MRFQPRAITCGLCVLPILASMQRSRTWTRRWDAISPRPVVEPSARNAPGRCPLAPCTNTATAKHSTRLRRRTPPTTSPSLCRRRARPCLKTTSHFPSHSAPRLTACRHLHCRRTVKTWLHQVYTSGAAFDGVVTSCSSFARHIPLFHRRRLTSIPTVVDSNIPVVTTFHCEPLSQCCSRLTVT